jgi:hypothetical protein
MASSVWKLAAVAVLGICLLAGPLLAQEAKKAETDECDRSSLTGQNLEDFIKKSKQPVPWLKWGADIRLREIYAPNLVYLDKNVDDADWHFQRYRFRAWATLMPLARAMDDGGDLDINFRMVWEPRHYCKPEAKPDPDVNEAIIDKLNVQWKNAFGVKDLTVKIGRQDIILGNGWLVLDGTPLDGSRTIFFDAVRAIYDAKDIKTKFDVAYICQRADSDQRLPPACDKDYHNIEQDEQGVIVYVTNTSVPQTQIDGYFLYKNDNAVLCGGNNSDIFAFGARVAGDIDRHWKYRAEFAQEMGEKNGNSLCAFGFNSRLSYFMRDDWNNNFRFGYEYLSGDRPSTGTNEAFDPLWGRWPQWSELYMYPVIPETGGRPGEVTNLHRVGVGWSCNPIKGMELCADYHLLFAGKNTLGGIGGFSKSGNFRGQILALLLRHKFNEHISTHVLAELFFPGDYYTDAKNDVAGFFRWELMFTY